MIEYDKEVTKVAKEWYHGNTQYIKLDYDSSLKLKCTMVPVVPHVKGNWHTCRWTERIGDMIKRECSTEYLVNSTYNSGEKHVTCESGPNNTNIITVDKEGDDTCILEISPANHLYLGVDWVDWTCTFHECETEDCISSNGCTAQTKIDVHVSNLKIQIPS